MNQWRTIASILLAVFFVTSLRAQTQYAVGDRYYANREYDLARLEYDRLLVTTPNDEGARLRAALSLMRARKYAESVPYLSGSSFSLTYLRLFALLRSGQIYSAAAAAADARENPSLSPAQKEECAALEGLLLLEGRQHEEARRFYDRLQKESDSDDVRRSAGIILTAQQEYEGLPKKSPVLGGILSALLPGAGQVYSGHYADGLTAFFFNAVFLGSAAAMYSLERRSNTKHTGSILLGAVGLVFYAANIAGGASAAVHFNLYQERTFQEKVRQSALNVDRAERAIQIRINVPLKP